MTKLISQLQSSKTKLTPALFWHSIDILTTKPHLVNKRLWGCKLWLRINCKPQNSSQWNFHPPPRFSRLETTVTAENVEEYLREVLVDAEVEICHQEDVHVEVILAELFSKSLNQIQVFQLILINKQQMSVTYHDVTQEVFNQKLCPNFPFTLKLAEDSIKMSCFCG